MSRATLSQIVDVADRLFPFDAAETWDNCGIQIGDPDRLIRSIAFSLDPTPETVSFASDHSCQLLVTHHPVLLEPIRSLVPGNLSSKTLLCAARMGVDILSLHTNLDAADKGLNGELARLLGLEEVSVPAAAPCARQGKLPARIRVRDLAVKVMGELEISSVRIVGSSDREVQKVFCVSGSGMGYLEQALSAGADVMITGDVRYHAAREALDAGMAVIDAGHYGLEKIAIPLLAGSFQSEFDRTGLEVSCFCCDREVEPFVDIYNP